MGVSPGRSRSSSCPPSPAVRLASPAERSGRLHSPSRNRPAPCPAHQNRPLPSGVRTPAGQAHCPPSLSGSDLVSCWQREAFSHLSSSAVPFPSPPAAAMALLTCGLVGVCFLRDLLEVFAFPADLLPRGLWPLEMLQLSVRLSSGVFLVSGVVCASASFCCCVPSARLHLLPPS